MRDRRNRLHGRQQPITIRYVACSPYVSYIGTRTACRLEARWRVVLLQPERRRRGGIERRSLRLLFQSRHLAGLRHGCRIHRGEALLPSSRAPTPPAAVAGNRLAQVPRTGAPRDLIQQTSRTRRRCWRSLCSPRINRFDRSGMSESS